DELSAWVVFHLHGQAVVFDTLPLHKFRSAEVRSALPGTGLAGGTVISSGFVPYGQPGGQLTNAQWEAAASEADVALSNLDPLPPRQNAEPQTPWSGTDWDDLQKVPRRLLQFLWGKEAAEIDDTLCRFVWGEDAEHVTRNAIHMAITKANRF